MKGWTAFGFVIALAGQAHALSVPPMTPEQIACYGNEDAVVVHVIDARSPGCGAQTPHCWPNYVGVTAVVDEVIAPSSGRVRTGDTIRASFSVTQPVGGNWAKNSGSINFPDGEITDQSAKSQLIGKRLFLSMASIRRSLKGGIPPEVDEPYYAEAFSPEDEEWFRATWASSGCRQQQAIAEGWRRKLGTGRAR